MDLSREQSSLVRQADKDFRIAGLTVDRRRVIDRIDNVGSIASSFTKYAVLDGVRSVPLSLFNTKLGSLFYAADDFDRAERLAEEIRRSRAVSPLIVVVDQKGVSQPYVLEGAHRLGALGLLRARSMPALVVVDLDD
jgi:hypothetical protein